MKLINHIGFVLDNSGSMSHLKKKAIETFNDMIDDLAKQARKSRQETRVSVWTFGAHTSCRVWEAPVSQVQDATDFYEANEGHTNLIDAAWEAVDSFRRISTRLNDHSFLLYVMTDGLENYSKRTGSDLCRKIGCLNDDYTVAALVPNSEGRRLAIQYGFPDDNIKVWETTEKGMEDVGHTFKMSFGGYTAMRSCGLKSTKTLFKFDEPTKTEVKQLEEVDPGTYQTLLVRKYDDGKAIKDFVETWTKRPYRSGSAYYQLTKPEIIQSSKTIALQEKATGKLFSDVEARSLLGLPSYEVKVAPADFAKFDIFVQSNSTNRKLVKDTQLIVFN